MHAFAIWATIWAYLDQITAEDLPISQTEMPFFDATLTHCVMYLLVRCSAVTKKMKPEDELKCNFQVLIK